MLEGLEVLIRDGTATQIWQGQGVASAHKGGGTKEVGSVTGAQEQGSPGSSWSHGREAGVTGNFVRCLSVSYSM